MIFTYYEILSNGVYDYPYRNLRVEEISVFPGLLVVAILSLLRIFIIR